MGSIINSVEETRGYIFSYSYKYIIDLQSQHSSPTAIQVLERFIENAGGTGSETHNLKKWFYLEIYTAYVKYAWFQNG